MSQEGIQSRFSDGPMFGVSYSVVIAHQRFSLTQRDLETEPDSIFTKLIRQIDKPHLAADPNLFRLIYAHLQGYEIFPLPPQGIPCGPSVFLDAWGNRAVDHSTTYLSVEATLKNLLRDAQEFGMKNLVAKIEKELASQALAQTASQAESQTLEDDSETTKGFVMLDSE